MITLVTPHETKLMDKLRQRKSNGITCMDVIKETKLIGAGQYIKTMMIDGIIRVERHHLPHTKQRVNHYYWSAT